ncbi:XRE family transcriptional regulator [Galactobacter valiniphilus]|uniref:XRE family transcriptional regulator n=1 Tax=Galactobacter valiniphilus TaxID=2676122 RepID=A0A399JDJ6_9MICC|nr:helix-turn-helix transcriptional regulator [Galactobacter valiniphilus]RII43618.1 XRE family transcriptional regulator [Galactobacter valiniphilus]
MDAMEIGARIKRARKALGVTQEELAELIGVSTRTLGQVERGTGTPSLATVLAAAAAVGVRLEVIP